ncbi:MAG: helix-turn-helix transcriptional regulator [Clostridia bacterium]|nr:helix-turn-helix transcriptional regulator [Clostridia bacterium]
MDWNKIVVTKIYNVIDVKVEKGKCGEMINRGFSGLVFSPEGEVVYRMNGKEFVSNGHNILYLPEGGSYTYESKCNGICPMINFHCDYDKSAFISFPVADIAIYENKFRELSKIHYNSSGIYSHHASFASFYDILVTIDKESAENEGSEYCRRAIGFMLDNISLPQLCCDKIALHLNISTVYLRKIFFAEKGIPPMSYLRKLRVERAKEFLKLPGKSIGEIAIEVGYSDIYSFSRAFKREMGMTPSYYALKYKNCY